jgi:hypothetical protein
MKVGELIVELQKYDLNWEGIWSSSDPMNLPINYHKRLVDAGFTYDPDFESFMRYGDDDEDFYDDVEDYNDDENWEQY